MTGWLSRLHAGMRWNILKKKACLRSGFRLVSGAGSERERLARIEYLRFQLQEMDAIDLQPGELEGLEAEHRILAHLDRMRELLGEALGALLEEADELKALAASSAGPPSLRLSAHVGAGILRVAVSDLPQDAASLEAWVSGLQGGRARLEERGGTLTLSMGPDRLVREVGAWGSAGSEKKLLDGLKAQFDPMGVLAPGRLGL